MGRCSCCAHSRRVNEKDSRIYEVSNSNKQTKALTFL
jgi:hypothetical protein